VKKALIAIIVLALVGGGVWYYTHRNKTASTTSSSSSSTSSSSQTQSADTVTFDGTAFSPASLTIKAGTTVTFVNNSDQPMWVASNPHPTHTDYPGFDELKGVGKGGTYSFKFDRVGTWGYHNHLDSGIMGTIVVQ